MTVNVFVQVLNLEQALDVMNFQRKNYIAKSHEKIEEIINQPKLIT
jgi:hypothetical protein